MGCIYNNFGGDFCVAFFSCCSIIKSRGDFFMFLFKNTKSKVKRIGMNMVVYGFAGIFVLMMLAVVLPKIIANYVYVLTFVCSFSAITGAIISVVCFFVELFLLAS